MKTTKQPLFMLVDDNDIDLFLNRKLLRVAGVSDNVISFLSAVDALEYLQENASSQEKLPAVILLDILMPEINGFQFLELFDKLPDGLRKSVKLIMLSSTVDPMDVERAHNNKSLVDILKKPLDTEALKEILVKKEVTKAA